MTKREAPSGPPLRKAFSWSAINHQPVSVAWFATLTLEKQKGKFQARLYLIAGSSKTRVHRGSFGSPEEVALHYAKLLKYEGNMYSA